jgi:hypothetical protein
MITSKLFALSVKYIRIKTRQAMEERSHSIVVVAHSESSMPGPFLKTWIGDRSKAMVRQTFLL